MLLSVIIVSYLHFDILSKCLDSIRNHNDIGDELEVIVSDNSPSNEIVNQISNKYSWVKVCKNKNLGFGAGNNRGVEISTGKYLLFLNPDTVIVEPIFRFAVQKFEDNQDLALFGLKLIGPNEEMRPSFIYLDVNDYLHQLYLNRIYLRRDKYNDSNMMIVGADIFIRRQIFVDAGMFDENIFMYYEESDLKRKVLKLSSQYYSDYFPTKKIIHLEGGTEENNISTTVDKIRRSLDSYYYYCVKWNISYRVEVKKMIRSNKIKKIIALIKGNQKNKYILYDHLNAVYINALNKYDSD